MIFLAEFLEEFVVDNVETFLVIVLEKKSGWINKVTPEKKNLRETIAIVTWWILGGTPGIIIEKSIYY